jgi:dolichol-phosphate mannosyltransferase
VSSAHPQAPRARWRAPELAIVIAACGLKLLIAVNVELLPEETYYWNYSRHLDIGYLDHPPMVAWLIRGGTLLFGNTALGVRFGALCSGAVAALFVYRLTRNLYGARSAVFALAIMQFLPFFFMAGVLMTPDAPLTAAWAAALYCLERAVVAGRVRSWAGVGLAIGLGLISKYTIALLGAAAVLFMLVDPAARTWFRRWPPYAAVVLAAVVFAPVIIWNAEHEWASFAFQTSRRLAEAPRFSLHKLIGAAMVLLTPVGFGAAVAALIAPARSRDRRFLRFAVLVPLSVFTFFSLRHEVKLDWTGAPWTAVLPLVSANGRRWSHAVWMATAAFMEAVYAAGLLYLTVGLPGVGYSPHTELLPVEWRDLARQVDALAAPLQSPGVRVLVVGMDRYAIASELAFYGEDQAVAVARTTSGHLFNDMGLMYERWFPAESLSGSTLLLVAWDPGNLEAAHLGSRVRGLEPIQERDLTRGGRFVRHFYYRVAHDYRYP